MKRLIVSVLLVTAVLVIAGCGAKAGGSKAQFGKVIPKEMATTDAKTITDSPKDFEGKDVLVQGKITSECPSGGWVWVKDNSGDIYVNMHPTNVFIPQKVGSTVRATGKVVLVDGRAQIVGEGLEF